MYRLEFEDCNKELSILAEATNGFSHAKIISLISNMCQIGYEWNQETISTFLYQKKSASILPVQDGQKDCQKAVLF